MKPVTGTSKPDVSLVIPVYEEVNSLQPLAQEIRDACEAASLEFEAWFVDDGSNDGSWSTIESIHRTDARFRGLRLQRNFGKSAALAAGFERARGRCVVTMDADLQDDPAEIAGLVSKIAEGYDLVSGWKVSRKDPWNKTAPSRLFNFVTRIVSGIRLHDFNCGLKAYRLEVVQSLRLYGEMHRYLPLLVKWAGFGRITERPVAHRPRRFGQSKFGAERYVRGFLDLLTILFLIRFGARPMHFFGTLGLAAFLGGFMISLWLTVSKIAYGNPVGDRPMLLLGALLIVVGVQTFCTGFLADLMNRKRMEERVPYRIAAVLD